MAPPPAGGSAFHGYDVANLLIENHSPCLTRPDLGRKGTPGERLPVDPDGAVRVVVALWITFSAYPMLQLLKKWALWTTFVSD